MSSTTGISWTDATWNPIRGCSRVSEGCRHCYAEAQAARIVRMGNGKPTAYDGIVKLVPTGVSAHAPRADRMEARWTGVVRLVPEHLADPLRWKKIAAVFGVMAACPQHTFQILTKRARRMREWFEWAGRLNLLDLRGFAQTFLTEEYRPYAFRRGTAWPLPNVWIGVSVENQDAADERIPELLDTPAAVRFLSCEPLLGEVSLFALLRGALRDQCLEKLGGSRRTPGIDWVIAGCESGPEARPCDVAWLRSLRDQCAEDGVPFFLKQAAGETARCDNPQPDRCGQVVRYQVVSERTAIASCGCTIEGGEVCDPPPIAEGDGSRRKPGGIIELPYLDGVQHAAFPGVPR